MVFASEQKDDVIEMTPYVNTTYIYIYIRFVHFQRMEIFL